MLDLPCSEPVKTFIAGTWVLADDARTFAVANPATGAALATVPSCGPAEAERAIAAASRLYDRNPDRRQAAERCQRIADVLSAHASTLARIITLENGKPLPESMGEVAYAAGFFREAAKHADALADEVLTERPRDCQWTVHWRPTGVVGLITPWNFPIAMIAKKLAPAIATGCPAVIMPSSKTPLSMLALVSLLEEHTDLPAGFISVLTGPPEPIADVLCAHPAVRFLSFTGSTPIGKQLMQRSAGSLKRLGLELGGNAPCLIFADADIDRAVQELMANKFRSGGQTCVCTNRVFVEEAIADQFVQQLQAAVAELTVGDGLTDGVTVGPLIDRSAWDKVAGIVEASRASGASCVIGGHDRAPDGQYGCYYQPTILTNVTDAMPCCQEEVFGPVLPVCTFTSDDEVIARANDTHYGLAAYFFTADVSRGERLSAELLFGHIGWNTTAGPTPEAPFGGFRESGFGREGGVDGLREYVEAQTIPRQF